MRTWIPTQIVAGPQGHGVTEYAADLADAIRVREPSTRILRVPSAEAAEVAVRDRGLFHVHVTDGLFGSDLEEAAARIERMGAASTLTLTLHDVPQQSDGARNLPRRASAYARFVAEAAGVMVNSLHESLLLAEHVAPLVPVEPRVVPLGTRWAVPAVDRDPDPASRETSGLRIVMSGYVYPGKGHDEAIDAAILLLGETPRRSGLDRIEIAVLGGASRGHEAEVDRLRARAAASGVELTVSGTLSDADYRRGMRSGGVPLVAHRHYSASRSLLDWAEQGRRPVVVETRYTREMARLRPGTLVVAADSPDALADALAAAWRDPASTYLSVDQPIGPTLDDAARAYLDWWRGDAQ